MKQNRTTIHIYGSYN